MEENNNEIYGSGYFHIMTRGINKQVIFEDQNDYFRYLNYVSKYSKKFNVNIIAYCLMSNHVHFLIYDPNNKKSKLMQCVNQCYVAWYNLKYNHVGSLIQNHFKRLGIENNKYLVNVFYYVLKNPLRAQICKAESYKWNSYKEYFHKSSIINNSMARDIYGDEKNLKHVIKEEEDLNNIIWQHNPEKDAIIRDELREKFRVNNIKEICRLNILKRNHVLSYLRKSGMTIKQISKATGISRNIIAKIK